MERDSTESSTLIENALLYNGTLHK